MSLLLSRSFATNYYTAGTLCCEELDGRSTESIPPALEDGVNRRDRRATSFYCFSGEQTQIFPIVSSDNLYADGYSTNKIRGDGEAR